MLVNNEHFVTIHGWMRTQLNLKGNDLMVYAIIYSFTQSSEQRCKGSLQFLADWCGATKQGIIKNIKSLLSKKLIAKVENSANGVNRVEYYATEFNTTEFNAPFNIVETPLNNVSEYVEHSLPRNKKSNKERHKEVFQGEKAIKRFTVPSVEDVSAYCVERGNDVDAQKFVDFYTSNGWMVGRNKMKDWKAAVRTWEKNSRPAKTGDVGKGGIKVKPEDQQDHSLDFIVKGV